MLTSYFEHVLQLPLAYHGEVHSGRLMKIMLQGTDTLWSFWLGFFREHLAAFVSLVILVPLALTLNWRLAILLIVLCVLFAVLTALILRKTETLQNTVQSASFRPRRARIGRARQYRAGAELRARRIGGARAQVGQRTAAGGAISGAVMVGGGDRAHARVDDAGGSLHYRARHLVVPAAA